MNRSDVCEAAARRDDREWRAWTAAKEEETGLRLPGILRLLVGVDVVKDRLAAVHVVNHLVQSADDGGSIHVAVVRQECSEVTQRHPAVVGTVVPWQQETGEASECSVVQQILNRVVRSQMPALGSTQECFHCDRAGKKYCEYAAGDTAGTGACGFAPFLTCHRASRAPIAVVDIPQPT